MKQKITLFLMSLKGLTVLQYIIDHYGVGMIAKVVSDTDPNVINDYYMDIYSLCSKHGIEFSDHRDEKIETDIAIIVSWKWLIHSDKKLIVLHDSLLPAYRGWNPLPAQLKNKEPVIGATAFIADEGIDTGEILFQESINIEYPITISKAIERMSAVYCNLVDKVINMPDSFKSTPQPKEGVSYSMWVDELDYKIDWRQSATRIVNFINAVSDPYKGATSKMKTKDWAINITITKASIYPDVEVIDRNRHIGKVIHIRDGKFIVIAGLGLVKIEEIYETRNEYKVVDMLLLKTRFHD